MNQGGAAGAGPAPYRACGAYDGGLLGGLCVPKVIVDASGSALAGSLSQDDCPLATDRCVPVLKVKDPTAYFQTCTTTLKALSSPGKDYGLGACVPAYVVRDWTPSALVILTRGICNGAEELCTPCLDPLSMPTAGIPTHFCE
jgi:hypothetical protein